MKKPEPDTKAPILYGVTMRRYRSGFRARGVYVYMAPIGWVAECRDAGIHAVWGDTPQAACRAFETSAVRVLRAIHLAQRVKPYWRKADLEPTK